MWTIQLRAIALIRVDFPEPFSPMKNVKGLENSSLSVFWITSRLKG
jgi:hypothetical protein